MRPVDGQLQPAQSASPTLDFAALYSTHAAFVWRSVRRLGVPEADVEDAAQETFVVIHRKLPPVRGGVRR
jgi:RNA polymerase sigma-70 factor (ECF subfamily)